MWWLHFNGQTKAWWRAEQKKDSKIDAQRVPEIFPDLPLEKVPSLVAIHPDIFNPKMFPGSSPSPEIQSLASPRKFWAVTKRRFDDFEFDSPECKPSATRRFKCSEEELDTSCKNFIAHDRLIFQSELKASLILCLKEKGEALTFFSFEINNGDDSMDSRHFTVRISGVSNHVCGFLWCAADSAARSSQVCAVREEQEYVDSLADTFTEEETLNNVVVNRCQSLPTIKIRPFGIHQHLERLTFQQFCGETFSKFSYRSFTAKISSMPVGEGIEVGPSAVNSDESDEDESDEVLVDDSDVEPVMSQKLYFADGSD